MKTLEPFFWIGFVALTIWFLWIYNNWLLTRANSMQPPVYSYADLVSDISEPPTSGQAYRWILSIRGGYGRLPDRLTFMRFVSEAPNAVYIFPEAVAVLWQMAVSLDVTNKLLAVAPDAKKIAEEFEAKMNNLLQTKFLSDIP